jgi:hypothetical protein
MSVSKAEFGSLYSRADAAGKAAAAAITPVPMLIKGYAPVLDGACGFAWITVYPGNCPFANYLKKNKLGSKAYGGGVSIWVGAYNQSIARKEAYAGGFAKVISEAGIKAYPGSRLD